MLPVVPIAYLQCWCVCVCAFFMVTSNTHSVTASSRPHKVLDVLQRRIRLDCKQLGPFHFPVWRERSAVRRGGAARGSRSSRVRCPRPSRLYSTSLANHCLTPSPPRPPTYFSLHIYAHYSLLNYSFWQLISCAFNFLPCKATLVLLQIIRYNFCLNNT